MDSGGNSRTILLDFEQERAREKKIRQATLSAIAHKIWKQKKLNHVLSDKCQGSLQVAVPAQWVEQEQQ